MSTLNKTLNKFSLNRKPKKALTFSGLNPTETWSRFSLNRKPKKAVSEVVAYVLLVMIAIVLAILINSWLRFYVSPRQEIKCPSDVSLIIKNFVYECPPLGIIEVTVQNKGLFKVDGFVLRVHNRTGANSGFYIINDTGISLIPQDESTKTYPQKYIENPYPNKGDMTEKINGYLTLIDVQGFIKNPEKPLERIFCERVSSQSIKANC